MTTTLKLAVAAACGLALGCTDRQPLAVTETLSGALRMDVVSGQGQRGAPGSQLEAPIVVRVVDASGNPRSGQVVNFKVTAGGGSVFAGTALTNAQGLAQEWWTLGEATGTNTLEARAVDSSTGERLVYATFSAEAVTGPATVDDVSITPATVELTSEGQTAQLTGSATDQYGDPISASFSWTSLNTAVASVSSSGVVRAVANGSTRVVGTVGALADTVDITVAIPSPSPSPSPSGDPQPTSSSTILFRDDFESYSSTYNLLHGGTYNTGGDGDRVISLGTTCGYVGSSSTSGGKCAAFNWPASSNEQWAPLEHALRNAGGGSGGTVYVSYYYRTSPNFIYSQSGSRIGKKHFLMNVGVNERVTVGIGRMFSTGDNVTLNMMQSNGVKLDAKQNLQPFGVEGSTGDLLGDGRWHRVTIERRSETSSGAMNGRIRIWVDGQLVMDLPNIGTGTASLINFQIASTFNGGSAQNQQEYHDNLVIWR